MVDAVRGVLAEVLLSIGAQLAIRDFTEVPERLLRARI
jgi:hypothetical protein